MPETEEGPDTKEDLLDIAKFLMNDVIDELNKKAAEGEEVEGPEIPEEEPQIIDFLETIKPDIQQSEIIDILKTVVPEMNKSEIIELLETPIPQMEQSEIIEIAQTIEPEIQKSEIIELLEPEPEEEEEDEDEKIKDMLSRIDDVLAEMERLALEADEQHEKDLNTFLNLKRYLENNPLLHGTKKLQQHQIDFAESFITNPVKGAIAIHGVGTGKTLTAVISSMLFLLRHPNSEVIVITPASVKQQFIDELKSYKPGYAKINKYKFFTFDAYTRNPYDCTGDLLIIDEAQNLKTAITYDKDGNVKQGRRVAVVLNECAKKARKILLLSATPTVNDPYEFSNMLALMNGEDPMSRRNFNQLLSSETQFRNEFNCKISFFSHDPDEAAAHFPNVYEKEVIIQMSKQTQKEYKEVEATFNIEDVEDDDVVKDALFNKVTKVINASRNGRNRKVKWLVNQILNPEEPESHNNKSVIFTDKVTEGVDILVNALEEAGVEVSVLSGKVPTNKRQSIIDNYKNGSIDVLIITTAAAEGVNLGGTGYLYIFNQVWNESLSKQILGRVRRFDGHSHLPENKRNVIIYQIFLIKPNEYEYIYDWLDNPLNVQYIMNGQPLSIDLYKKILSLQKQIRIDVFLDNLATVERVEDCRERINMQDENKIKVNELNKFIDQLREVDDVYNEILDAVPEDMIPDDGEEELEFKLTIPPEEEEDIRQLQDNIRYLYEETDLPTPTTIELREAFDTLQEYYDEDNMDVLAINIDNATEAYNLVIDFLDQEEEF